MLKTSPSHQAGPSATAAAKAAATSTARRQRAPFAQGIRLKGSKPSSPAKPLSPHKAGKSKYASTSVSSTFVDLQSASSQGPMHEIDEDAKRLEEVEEELAGLRDRRMRNDGSKDL